MLCKKFALLLGLSFLLGSCSSAKFLKAEKYKVLPGVSTGNTIYRYILDVEINSNVKFVNLQLDDEIVKTKFSVTDLKSNMQSDNSKLYSKGKYRLQFDLPMANIGEDNNEVLKLTYKSGSNIETLSKKIDSVEILQLK